MWQDTIVTHQLPSQQEACQQAQSITKYALLTTYRAKVRYD